MIMCLIIIVFSNQTRAFAFSFSDFSNTADLTLNGDANGNVDNGIDPNPVLRLVPAANSQVGSAFTDTTFNSDGFSTFFQFRISDSVGDGADGIVFVLQTGSPTEIGGGGQGIGYEGIANSVGVEFDTWDNNSYNDPIENHLGINTNGNMESLDTDEVANGFEDASLWSAWIDYDNSTDTLEVRTNTTGIRSLNPNLSRNIDIVSTIGSPNVYVGFTAATGGVNGNHDLIQWEYRDEYDPIGTSNQPIPEPTTVALLGIGLVGMAGVVARRKWKKKAVDKS